MGRLGLPVNVLAVVWGVVVVVNIGWPRPAIYGSDRWGRFAAPLATLALIAVVLCVRPVMAQSEDETDPVKLFDKGQDAHAKGDYKLAVELYEAAIKLKPEFPEAEFQRAMALLFSNHKAEAIEGFNRAVALRPDWAMAYSKFGGELAFTGNNDREAEPILRRAVELNDKDVVAMTHLAVLRGRNGGALDEGPILVGRAVRPTVAQRETEPATLRRVERGDVRGEIHRFDLRAHGVIERGVLEWGDLSEPVAGPAPLTTREQPVEQMMRRGVDDDA